MVADIAVMVRWLALVAVIGAAVATACTATASVAQSKHAASPSSYVRTIVPNVGIGGVDLGESMASVHRQLGGSPETTGYADSGFGEYWMFGTLVPTDILGPVDALSVEYAWINGKPGPASFLGTPGAWTIAGTNIVSHHHGDLAALRRYYGKRLLGPYVVGPPTGKDGSSAVYYELPGRYLGRAVHTLFGTTTYRPLADEFDSVSVSFCVSTALFRSALDQPCHTA